MNEKKQLKIRLVPFILLIFAVALISGVAVATAIWKLNTGKAPEDTEIIPENKIEVKEEVEEEIEDVEEIENTSQISSLDFNFMKLENTKENMVYSPLSIKYALKMLEDGADGETKEQISKLTGRMSIKKYNSNDNMAFANSLFVRDTFRESIKKTYINGLKNKYNAEVIIDTFEDSKTVNDWVEKNTLDLIPNILPEGKIDNDFLLINALGIDMEWVDTFIEMDGSNCVYSHTTFGWWTMDNVVSMRFGKDNQKVSGMDIGASVNRYDIVATLGEENIRKTVGDEYRIYYEEDFKTDKEKAEAELERYLDYYIESIDSNYRRIDYSTDFSYYTDDEVKVFAKDLKEYEGTKLQYIGIMPIKEELDDYIYKVDDSKISSYIENLISFDKIENFKKDVVTKVKGYIPKFDFEYELSLEDDLKKLGVVDIFDEEKADLSKLTNVEDAYINKAIHKANIEFTQDGIKAAAATMFGGLGAGGDFDYYYDLPVEEIDLTFNKPYMYLIRDVKNGEVWFAGAVYEPLDWEDEPEGSAGHDFADREDLW